MADAVMLLGIGESSDAYQHVIASPRKVAGRPGSDATGRWTPQGLQATDIDYINLPRNRYGRSNDTTREARGPSAGGARVGDTRKLNQGGPRGHGSGARRAPLEAVICGVSFWQHGFMPAGG